MIKLQEFARQMSVTDRAIQKHLKKYETELAGLFERKGKNGTWLTDEACEFLRGKMKPQSVELYDPAKDEEIKRLKERIAYLEDYAAGKEKYIVAMEAAAQMKQERIAELEQNQFLLESKLQEETNAAAEQLQQAQQLADQLEAKLREEESRPLSFMERLTGRKRINE